MRPGDVVWMAGLLGIPEQVVVQRGEVEEACGVPPLLTVRWDSGARGLAIPRHLRPTRTAALLAYVADCEAESERLTREAEETERRALDWLARAARAQSLIQTEGWDANGSPVGGAA